MRGAGHGPQNRGCWGDVVPLTLPAGRAMHELYSSREKDETVSKHEPMFNVPGSVLAVLGVLVAVHVLLAAMPETWANWWTGALAFIPIRYDGYARSIPGGYVAEVTSFLTYATVHGSLFHLAINSAWLLAFGGVVAARTGPLRFFLFSAVCAIGGAVVFLILNPGLAAPMVGASGAVSGLMGATMRFLFPAIDADGLRALREDPHRIALMPLSKALVDRRVLFVTGVFLLANLLAVMGLGGVTAGGIAWQAHLGGYFTGFLCFGLFERNPRSVHSDWPAAN
jgi:membrane associated rhomboid family serine protease